MKIAIYSDNFYPEMSGISDSIIALAQDLSRRGHKVNFYAPRYSKKNFRISKLEPKELDLGKNIEIFRLPSIPYPSTPTKQGRIALPILSSYRHLKKFDPDVIYTQDFFFAGIEALVISKLLKKPLVGTNHTPISEFLKYAPVHWNWLEKLILKYVSWYYNKCLWVSAPSQPILDEMKIFGLKRESRAISNPIYVSDYQPASDTLRDDLKKKIGFSEKTVLYTGRLADEKNIDVIIHAISLVKKKFPSVTFVVTGHGNGEAKLKKLTKKLGLEKNILFLGYVETSIFIKVYQASDVFTVMSTAETQCISMMQAMATGIPVIGANSWGLPDYINSENGYLVEPGDVETLAEKIIYLFENPEERKRLGQGGLKFVQKFGIKNIADEWGKIFARYSNNHRPE
jgi:glycosyltransferase involved in cell wall biosynthesis